VTDLDLDDIRTRLAIAAADASKAIDESSQVARLVINDQLRGQFTDAGLVTMKDPPRATGPKFRDISQVRSVGSVSKTNPHRSDRSKSASKTDPHRSDRSKSVSRTDPRRSDRPETGFENRSAQVRPLEIGFENRSAQIRSVATGFEEPLPQIGSVRIRRNRVPSPARAAGGRSRVRFGRRADRSR